MVLTRPGVGWQAKIFCLQPFGPSKCPEEAPFLAEGQGLPRCPGTALLIFRSECRPQNVTSQHLIWLQSREKRNTIFWSPPGRAGRPWPKGAPGVYRSLSLLVPGSQSLLKEGVVKNLVTQGESHKFQSEIFPRLFAIIYNFPWFLITVQFFSCHITFVGVKLFSNPTRVSKKKPGPETCFSRFWKISFRPMLRY